MKWLDEWNRIQNLEPRAKYAGIKSLANSIRFEAKSIPETEIAEVIEVLNKCTRVIGNDSQLGKVRSQLILKKLTITENDQINILQKISLKLSIESGTIMIGDPQTESAINLVHYDNSELVEVMNQGRGLVFSTGGDGEFEVQLRLVDALEPVLTPNEYKLVTGSTDTLIIKVESGAVVAGDLGRLGDSDRLLEVDPGYYKICAYRFDTGPDFCAYYVVLTKTDQSAENQVQEVFELHL